MEWGNSQSAKKKRNPLGLMNSESPFLSLFVSLALVGVSLQLILAHIKVKDPPGLLLSAGRHY